MKFDGKRILHILGVATGIFVGVGPQLVDGLPPKAQAGVGLAIAFLTNLNRVLKATEPKEAPKP